MYNVGKSPRCGVVGTRSLSESPVNYINLVDQIIN